MSTTRTADGRVTAETTRRILIVEDNAAVAGFLASIAKNVGEVTVEATVGGALEQLASHATWVAFIIDLGLPDGSGLAVVSHVRAKDRDVPTLVLSGNNEHDAINAAFDLRAQYLAKPATHAQIEGIRPVKRTLPRGVGMRQDRAREWYALSPPRQQPA
jgi:CheY-like chemotaxis protein